MQSQCDSGCVDLKKNEERCVDLLEKNEELCSLSLVDTVILDQSANTLPWFEMKSCLFPAATSEILRNSICILFGCFKTKKIVCILVISVMSNIFKCYKSRYSCPYFSELTFQDTEDFNMYTMFLLFESFQFSSNVRNPITPAMACLSIPMLILHIHSHHSGLY